MHKYIKKLIREEKVSSIIFSMGIKVKGMYIKKYSKHR
jgi:hypothetical protein